MTFANPTPQYNLLMLSGDSSVAQGEDGAFFQMLARFSQYWQRIDILTPTAPDAQARIIHENVYIHPSPLHRLMQPLFIKHKGEQLLKERQYYLITSHDFGFFYNGIGATWLLSGKDISLVSEIHHIEGYPIATSLRERLWRLAARQYLPFIARKGAYFRVVNSDVAQQLETLGVTPERIRKLYSIYLDLDIYQPQKTEKRYDVLFIARLATNKGIMLLLDAIRLITKKYPKIILAIRGDGILKPQIEHYITSHHLEENIIFLPRVRDSAMPELYNQAKMLVCASTVEGNPRVTIEAMACGTPVISTRVGIMPEVIRHGENGLLVDWDASEIAKAIQQLLDDNNLYRRISEAGQKSVQQFDADKTIHAYAKAYHDIIEQNQKHPT